MKLSFILTLIFFLFVSCNNNTSSSYKKNNANNLLIDDKVTVYSLFSYLAQKELPWKNNFNINSFINSVLQKAINDNLKLFSCIYDDTTYIEIDKENLKEELNKYLSDTFKFSAILFYESWSLDTNNHFFNLTKNVEYWAPIIITNNKLKTTFKIKCTTDNNKLLTNKVFYEYPLYDTLLENTQLNKKKLVKILINWALNNPEKVYNPFTAKPMNKKELYNKLNIYNDKYIPYNDINSLIFVENWYYNKNNYSIKKEIIALAPVIYTYENDEIQKQIIFVVHYQKEPFALL